MDCLGPPGRGGGVYAVEPSGNTEEPDQPKAQGGYGLYAFEGNVYQVRRRNADERPSQDIQRVKHSGINP